MRWLITGGCGFIGRNLVAKLGADPANTIRVFDDLSVGRIEELAEVGSVLHRRAPEALNFQRGAIELVVGDICDAAAIMAAAAGAQVMVHLAANSGVALAVADPMRDCMINVTGTLNSLQAARKNKVSRFVFASSGAPLGTCEPPLHEKMAPRPASPYGASKLAGEAYCSAYYHCFGVETVALRFANVYGPRSGHKTSIVAKLIREALNGQPWTMYGDGQQSRDFIYVDDLCDVIIRSARVEGIGGEIFQIATNCETRILDLVERLGRVLATHGVATPKIVHRAKLAGDVRRNFSDISKAVARLQWRPSVTLDDGLELTLRWFLESRWRK
jgi:UDP-glucose 4-epimerase